MCEDREPGYNIDYWQIASDASIPVADESVDLVYSFAVVQHVTDVRLKWRYWHWLWCFSRSREAVESLVVNAGFRSIQIMSIADLGADLHGDDIEQQHLCIFPG